MLQSKPVTRPAQTPGWEDKLHVLRQEPQNHSAIGRRVPPQETGVLGVSVAKSDPKDKTHRVPDNGFERALGQASENWTRLGKTTCLPAVFFLLSKL